MHNKDIYPSTLTNASFVEKKLSFIEGKKPLLSNRNCSFLSGADPWWGFKGQNPTKIWLLMSLRELNSMQRH